MIAAMLLAPHQRFSRRTRLSEAQIAAFAQAAGDDNPLHHDRELAASAGYGGVIASGAQSSGLLMGLVASHVARLGAMVGIEFNFRFKAGVPADEELTLEWLVISVRPTSTRGRELVELRGRLRTAAGVTAVGAKGRVLVSDAG